MLKNLFAQLIRGNSARRLLTSSTSGSGGGSLLSSTHNSTIIAKSSYVTKSNESASDGDNSDQQTPLEFQKDASTGIRNLERIGKAKPTWSWPQYNRIVYPPSEDGEPIKNPYVHHMRTFIKYNRKKLWYPAFLIRGMSIEEAIKQLSFHQLKGAAIIKDTLLEAQEMAVKEHNIEFKSNMWISYSTAVTAGMVKGVRKHKATQMGIVKYRYSHYYVRLEEGKPPANYHLLAETYEHRAKEYIEKLRKRSIFLSI